MYNSTVRKNTWHFSAGAGTHTQLGRQAHQIFGEAGIYPVTLLVEDHNGCADTITKPIVVQPPEVFYVPDAFTPNHDGRNEMFGPVISTVKNYQLSIFNRWGEKIFETTDLTTGWNGSWKGEACKQDSYVWVMRFLNKDGLQTKTGRVLLLR